MLLETYKIDVGFRLKMFLDRKFLAVSDIAPMLGLTNKAVYDILKGQTGLSTSTLFQLTELFDDLDLNWLIKKRIDKEADNSAITAKHDLPELTTIGKRLRHLRQILGLSAGDMAKAVDMAMVTIYHTEQDRYPPNFAICSFLFKQLDLLNPQWFFFGTGELYVIPADALTTAQHQLKLAHLAIDAYFAEQTLQKNLLTKR